MNNLMEARKMQRLGNKRAGQKEYGNAFFCYVEAARNYEQYIEQEEKRKARWKRWAKQAWDVVKFLHKHGYKCTCKKQRRTNDSTYN